MNIVYDARVTKWLRKFERQNKLIQAVLMIGMFAFALNIPTPVVVQKDLEVAFPCQNRPCGCENAQQCWDSCCCFSDAEKLVWAQANQITPPDWFLERIADEQLIARLQAKTDKPTAAAAQKKSSCCCGCKPDQSSSLPSKKTIAVRTTIQQVLGCQGKQEFLKKQIVCILVPAEKPVAFPYWQSLPMISESGSSLAIAPPTPPS